MLKLRREHDAPADHYQVYSGEVRIGTIRLRHLADWVCRTATAAPSASVLKPRRTVQISL